LKINTSKFGALDIDDKKIISFENGILGFENVNNYALLRIEETLPFFWLQAIDNQDISLSCMNPFDIIPDYNPTVEQSALNELQAEEGGDLLVLTTVVVPAEPIKATTNLAAPIIINSKNNKGIQVILRDTQYNIKQPIFAKEEETRNVDTVKEAK